VNFKPSFKKRWLFGERKTQKGKFWGIKVFLLFQSYIKRLNVIQMKTAEVKTIANVLDELNEGYLDLMRSMKGTIKEFKATRQLWKKGNKSILIKLGLALIVFPDPTISDVIGTFLIAAGTVQEGIRRRTLYIEDVHKTLQDTFKEIRAMKNDL